jgi:RHS repeat-associated protein
MNQALLILAALLGSFTSASASSEIANPDSAFGVRTATGTLPDFVPNEIGFTGREHDAATGLIYYRARYMDPVLGRFISEDPIKFEAGDFNVGRHVGNNPFGYFDSSGMMSTLESAKLYGALILRTAATSGFVINSAGAIITFHAYVKCLENSPLANMNDCNPILVDSVKFGVNAIFFATGRILLLRGGYLDKLF